MATNKTSKFDGAGLTMNGQKIASSGSISTTNINLPKGTNPVLAPWGNSNQLVILPEGTVSVDEFVRQRRELEEWKLIQGIIEKHQIINEWPDGDIVIRVQRSKITKTEGALFVDELARAAIVDFGVEEEE